jgi:nitroreductase
MSEQFPTISVAEAIRTKRAVRQFTDQPASEEAIRAVLNAGRRSQSSKNTQPWTFVAITERTTLEALSKTGGYTGHLAGAAFAVVIVAQPGYKFDVGQAAAYMQLAAWELGLGSCIASLHDEDAARAILGVPGELECYTAISFGYPAAPPAAPRPGGRRSFEEAVRWEQYSSDK